MTFVAQM